MSQKTACKRMEFIRKLQDELNFYGPVSISGRQYMLYNGQRFAIPENEIFTVSQFRTLIREVDGMVSSEEWQF